MNITPDLLEAIRTAFHRTEKDELFIELKPLESEIHLSGFVNFIDERDCFAIHQLCQDWKMKAAIYSNRDQSLYIIFE